MMHAVMCRCRMRTKQKGKMTFTGTSNASSSGLQRTGSEISDSKFLAWYLICAAWQSVCAFTIYTAICTSHLVVETLL